MWVVWLGFTWVLGSWAQVVMLPQKAVYPLSHPGCNWKALMGKHFFISHDFCGEESLLCPFYGSWDGGTEACLETHSSWVSGETGLESRYLRLQDQCSQLRSAIKANASSLPCSWCGEDSNATLAAVSERAPGSCSEGLLSTQGNATVGWGAAEHTCCGWRTRCNSSCLYSYHSGGWQKEDQEFKVSLSYIAGSCPQI